MKDFERITLYEDMSGEIKVYVGAYMRDSKLIVYGQDLGEILLRWFPDSEYEYFYTFDEKGTIQLLNEINGLDNPQEALKEHFSGIRGTMNLENFCKEKGIRYSFDSYM